MRVLSITLTLCCFAILSIASVQAAPTPVYRVLKACIDSHPDGGDVLEMYTDGANGNWAVLCEGAVAAKVWDTLYPYRVSEESKRQADKSQTDSFHIGTRSYCIKVVTNPDGTPGNHIECTLYLDLNDVIEKTFVLTEATAGQSR
ncbi:MAG: hypothetical protein ACHP9S_11495 [Terriglobales bacterium]